MSNYRYLLANTITNQVIAELPLTAVSFTQQLNSAGTFQGTILLADVNVQTLNVINSTVPGQISLYVDRDNTIVWGGLIWARTYQSSTQHLQVTAQEFETYLAHRVITTTNVFNNVDIYTIIETLITQIQAVPNGNIGIIVPTTLSGITATITYYAYELKSVLQAIQDLSKASNSFDFYIKAAYDGGGNITKTLTLGSPRLGRVYSLTDLSVPVFEFPAGNIVEYEYAEDGTTMANVVYVSGAGSNEGALIASATDVSGASTNYPVLETVANYSNVSDATLLGSLAFGQEYAVRIAPVSLKIVAVPYVDPVLGSYAIGDDARVRILDERFPNGLDTVYRIMALSVQAGESGPERVTITLTLPQV